VGGAQTEGKTAEMDSSEYDNIASTAALQKNSFLQNASE